MSWRGSDPNMTPEERRYRGLPPLPARGPMLGPPPQPPQQPEAPVDIPASSTPDNATGSPPPVPGDAPQSAGASPSSQPEYMAYIDLMNGTVIASNGEEYPIGDDQTVARIIGVALAAYERSFGARMKHLAEAHGLEYLTPDEVQQREQERMAQEEAAAAKVTPDSKGKE